MVAIIIWLDNFGVNVTALIAALGIAGLALSLAAQDTLADAISGLVILLDQPFRIDDQIEVEELGTYADVIEVGTRTSDNCNALPNTNDESGNWRKDGRTSISIRDG